MRSITYFGHTCFLVRLGDSTALFNPVISDSIGGKKRIEKSALNPKSIKQCDLIFLSNEEPGNCEPETAAEIAERTFASIVAPAPALSKISASDRLKIEAKEGDRFTSKGFEVEVVKALHPQSRQPVGYVIKAAGTSVYHAGDTYSYRDMLKINCDIALVPIGGGTTMDPFAANSSVKEMRPKIAIPMKFNTYESIMQDPQEFVSDLGNLTRGISLKPGQEMKL